ncbi:hypothetical protein BpHYR1_032335 [Brachionus plicatilis]|uniref:Uncharacterized protein n=1 Tax=Brachionus plicatilis TaxID=10195 RepID=A0A3M7S1C6_BRAPC|nr:hypothetical protein BpHYR1_032335 [Brachionus plicatilis]
MSDFREFGSFDNTSIKIFFFAMIIMFSINKYHRDFDFNLYFFETSQCTDLHLTCVKNLKKKLIKCVLKKI